MPERSGTTGYPMHTSGHTTRGAESKLHHYPNADAVENLRHFKAETGFLKEVVDADTQYENDKVLCGTDTGCLAKAFSKFEKHSEDHDSDPSQHRGRDSPEVLGRSSSHT
jgi:hypothetical protein